jgi:rhodanese-related sulfurtransferase
VLVAVLLLVGAAVGVVACGSDQASPPAASRTADAAGPLGVEAFAAAAAKPGTTVIDVRTPAEYAAGHLAGAVNIDVQGPNFADAVAELDPSARYAVYCHSGNRSAVAVSYLADHGFTHVAELAGGIAAWQAAGRPVTTG